MTVQTFNQNENNRDDNIKNEANNMLRSLWLGRRDGGRSASYFRLLAK